MSAASPSFGRVLGALPTPFDERGRIDGAAVDHLVGYLGDRGLGGLALMTEVGEAAFLEPMERRQVVDRVAARASGRIPFWVQVNEIWTRAAVDAARHAEEAGAAGLLLGLPRLPDVGYPELYRHLDRLGRAVSAPILLMARPGDLISALAPEEQATLAQHPRLAGIVLAERAPPHGRAWTRRFEGRGEVLVASTFELFEAARFGAVGAVCALSILAPEPARAMVEATRSGDLEAVRKLERRLRPALDRLGPPRSQEAQGSVERLAERIARRSLDGARLRPLAPPALLKEGLRLQGHRLKTFVRPPQPQLTDGERERLKGLLKGCGLLA